VLLSPAEIFFESASDLVEISQIFIDPLPEVFEFLFSNLFLSFEIALESFEVYISEYVF